MARLIDWGDLLDLDTGDSMIIALDSLSAVFIQALSVWYNYRFYWVDGGNPVTDEQWDAIQALISQTELDIMSAMVGLILPNVLATLGTLTVLDCDGATYLRVDYPLLYAAIAPAYIIDADNFSVPNLQNRVALGASFARPIGTVGGENEVTLTEQEMPVHTHTTQPHDHTYTGTIPSVDTGGAGPPLPAVQSAPNTTGLQTVIVDNAGNSDPHNNMQSFEAISYVIVAG